jgi:fimbrial chaperone protein
MRQAFKAVFFLLSALAGDQAPAATLSVSPVSFDIEAPRQNAKLTLQNRGNDAVATQIRVFRWEKKNGTDSLVPTKDVVASPPVAKLKPGAKHTVRIVRVAKRPVEAEESYRLLVDQLPKPVKRTGSQVSLLIRQSIPVFFSTGESDRTPLTWSADITGGELVLTARNGGARTAFQNIGSQSGGFAERAWRGPSGLGSRGLRQQMGTADTQGPQVRFNDHYHCAR